MIIKNRAQTNCSMPCNASSSRRLCRDFRGYAELFWTLETGVPMSDSVDAKLSWLNTQVVGCDADFESPFGWRRIRYADHTASGRSLRCIENYILNNVLPFYGNTHTTDSYVGHRTTKMVHEASDYIKRCLGGEEDDVLLFCGSGTTAAIKRLQEVMAIAIPSSLRDRILKIIRSEERWVVFIGPYEHHSNILSWRQSLAEVVEIGLDNNGLIDMEALRVQLEMFRSTNRPILGSFSACSNVTGTFTDTRALARLLHQYGAFVCFDFAASGPYVKIDMRTGYIDGYDAVFLSPHKFLGGPGSPGILLMNRTLYRLGSSPPSTCGGGTVNFVNGFSEKDTLYVEEIEERENAGTPPIIQMIRTALAFWIKDYIGHDAIEKKECTYIEKAFDRLLKNQNIRVLGNTTAKRLAILSFQVYSTIDIRDEKLNMWAETGNVRGKPLHGAFVSKLLNDLFGIQARGGCDCAGPYGHSLLDVDETRSRSFRSAIQKGYIGIKPGWTRISFPYYMMEEEFEFILLALEFVAMYGQRFLPLYHFNWKTGTWSFKKNVLKKILIGKENDFESSESMIYSARKALSLDATKVKPSIHESMVHKYTSYTETATKIASLLPKFPSPDKVPDDIEPELLTFRV